MIKKVINILLICIFYTLTIINVNAINKDKPTYNFVNSYLTNNFWNKLEKKHNGDTYNFILNVIEKKYDKKCENKNIYCFISHSAHENKIYTKKITDILYGNKIKIYGETFSFYGILLLDENRNPNCINSKLKTFLEKRYGDKITLQFRNKYIFVKNKGKWENLNNILLKNGLAILNRKVNHKERTEFSRSYNLAKAETLGLNDEKYCKKYGKGGFWEDIDSWIVLDAGLNIAVHNKISKNSFKEISRNSENFNKIGELLDISPRIIAAPCFAEKIRQTDSYRAKIRQQIENTIIKDIVSDIGLHSFSEGLCSIKPQIAIEIEKNLKNPNSRFYLGKQYSHLLDYKNNENSTKELVKNRLLDDYRNILYAAIDLKMHENLWEKSGYSIKGNAGVLATLYNLGFYKSHPHENPKNGGAYTKLEIKKPDGTKEIKELYFGDISEIFYNSNYIPEIKF